MKMVYKQDGEQGKVDIIVHCMKNCFMYEVIVCYRCCAETNIAVTGKIKRIQVYIYKRFRGMFCFECNDLLR